MGYTPLDSYEPQTEQMEVRRKSSWVLHLGLFILTVASCIMAGTAWSGSNPQEIGNWRAGIQYGVLIVTFLAAHEFGHYFAARAHGVDATLPYFIPLPPFPYLPPFGTMGALIRTRSPIMTRTSLFDIGIAGPLAGFVVCVAFLIIGFATLPPQEYIYSIHPEYRLFGGEIPAHGLYFGDTMLYHALASVFANPNGWLPPMNEMYHYPFLCVGWFGIFLTAINLLPLGQLDGGHIAYAMFGERQFSIGRVAWTLLLVMGLGSLMGWAFEALVYDSPDTFFTMIQSMLLPPLTLIHRIVPGFFSAYGGWLAWAVIVRVFIKIEHPPVDDDEPLGAGRMALGWVAAAVLVVSFSFNGIYYIETTRENQIPKKRRGGAVTSHVQHSKQPQKPLQNTFK